MHLQLSTPSVKKHNYYYTYMYYYHSGYFSLITGVQGRVDRTALRVDHALWQQPPMDGQRDGRWSVLCPRYQRSR